MAVVKPCRLRCEYLDNPKGIIVPKPRFSWTLESDESGQKQCAYRIVVSESEKTTASEQGEIWNTGKVRSGNQVNIPFEGIGLKSERIYFWKVRCWGSDDSSGEASSTASFETGLFRKEEWKAEWITRKNCRWFSANGIPIFGPSMAEFKHTHAIYLRKEFRIDRPLHRARVMASALGLCRIFINGKPVEDRVLDPAQTDFRKRALCSTYDITRCLQEKNALGVILGNGRHLECFGYGKPKVMVRVAIDFADGSRMVIGSDERWKTSHGPIRENGLVFGEHVDRRLDMPGWDHPDFDDRSWEPAETSDGPVPEPQMMPPIRICQKIHPINLYSREEGIYVADFGQNFSGWIRLQAQGPAGTEIFLRHAENIHEDGSINTGSNQNAEARDVYVLNGKGMEILEPSFAVHGFRYAEIRGYPGVTHPNSITGCFVHTDVKMTGEFLCSSELFNKIHRNVRYGILSNIQGIPTDCPQRNERYGWLGDAHLGSDAAVCNFNMAAFYTKFLEDIRLSQNEDGSLPDIVPPYLAPLLIYPTDPAWGTAYPSLVSLMVSEYGDIRILDLHYRALTRYIQFLLSHLDDRGLSTLGKYGEWCSPGRIGPKNTPLELVATAYLYHDLVLMCGFAKILKKTGDQKAYKSAALQILENFNRFFSKGNNYSGIKTCSADDSIDQTSQILPLVFGMVPRTRRKSVFQSLVHSLEREHGTHPDTGIFGTRHLLDVLCASGRSDLAWKVVSNTDYPGWGYMIMEGATTLWERWETKTANGMNSQNHVLFSGIDAWLYQNAAGLVRTKPGWKEFFVHFPLVEFLSHGSARLMTVQGGIRVGWEKDPGCFRLNIRVPVGSRARVVLPPLWNKTSFRVDENPIRARGQTMMGLPKGVEWEDNKSFRMESGSHCIEMTCQEGGS